MAWLDRERTGIFQIGFKLGKRRFKRSLKIRDEKVAEELLHRLEESIRLVSTGRLEVPTDVDVASFLLSDGRVGKKQLDVVTISLGEIFERYRSGIPVDSLSAETLRIASIHINHLAHVIGPKRQLQTIKRDDLQHYINVRSQATGKRGRFVSTGTIQKELSTLRTLWRWFKQSGLVTHDFPNQGLRYPRHRQKQPFLTWEQIQNRIARGIPEGQSDADYWDCLYLNR